MLRTASALLLLLCLHAGAAELLVNPVRVDLSPRNPASVITLKNASEIQKVIQIQTVAWMLRNGNPVEAPTEELQVSPQSVTLPPGSSQTLRAVLKRAPDAERELSYRIYLREYVAQPKSGFSGVRIAMRTGLPVFVQAQNGAAAPKLAWTLSRPFDRSLKLALRNDGNAHVQISRFALHLPGRPKPLAEEAHPSYVLAAQAQEWLFRIDPVQIRAGDRLRLTAQTDSGAVEAELAISVP